MPCRRYSGKTPVIRIRSTSSPDAWTPEHPTSRSPLLAMKYASGSPCSSSKTSRRHSSNGRAVTVKRGLVDARRGVQLVDPPQGLVTVASAELRQRFDANATLTHGLRSGGQRQRRPCEREDLLVGANDLDEAAAHDELTARRAVVGPRGRG